MCQYVRMRNTTASPGRPGRRGVALSKEHIIAVAIAILDEKGDSALTFRTLSHRLRTGAGAIYHYVANKDELLSAATNTVIGEALAAVQPCDNPADEIRALSLALFDVFEAHFWVGYELSQENRREGLGFAQICEALGAQLDALGVPADDQFNVASALGSYITGSASQNAANARLGMVIALQGLDRTTYLTQLADRWKRRLDPAEYPFVHTFLAKMPTHDDREQFLTGIDLLLAGIAGRY